MSVLTRLALGIVAVAHLSPVTGEDDLSFLEKIVTDDPKPFVIVEAEGDGSVNHAQGVVITPQGDVLSAGHVSWVKSDQSFTDKFRISFRGKGEGLPQGVVHSHRAIFSDRENAPFLERFFHATLRKNGKTRFVGKGDLSLFRLKGEKGEFPSIDFFSEEKPKLQIGETLYLCHYTFPSEPGDPTFLINPVEIVGVADTSSGLQYLAKGYYRVGSSGAALLKDGGLVGIQSGAYTVNAKDIGEMPLGLISFELVWADLIKPLLASPSEKEANQGGREQ